MVELSEDIKNSIFRWYFKVSLVMGLVIVTPLSLAYFYLYEGTTMVRYVFFIFLMMTVPMTLAVGNFTFKLIFPLMIKFKQKSMDVVYQNKTREFSVYYKDIESAVLLDDIMGVNACRFNL